MFRTRFNMSGQASWYVYASFILKNVLCTESWVWNYNLIFLLLFWIGNVYYQTCASPDISEAIFETRGTNQVCEWLNDGINGDSICYCKSDECNTIETLASWIQNGGVCKFHISFFFILFSLHKTFFDDPYLKPNSLLYSETQTTLSKLTWNVLICFQLHNISMC